MKTMHRILALATLALPGAPALAADVLEVDLTNPTIQQLLNYRSASEGVMHTVDIRANITHNRRRAFTPEAPLLLPCDLDWLSAGLSWRNVSPHPIYPEMSAMVSFGDEKRPLLDRMGHATPFAPSSATTAAGAIGTGGYFFVPPEPLVAFTTNPALADPTLAYMNDPGYLTAPVLSSTPGFLPANVPLKIAYRVRAFSAAHYDHVRGGYSLADLVPDNIIWNDCYVTWIMRQCPGQ